MGYVPVNWKSSTLVPVPKGTSPQVNNDLRPVALTDLVMKHFERSFGGILAPEVVTFRDPLQFAYTDCLGVEDALLTVLHTVYNHLDTQGSYVRSLFIDFSSAFNTISPLVLVKKLIAMNVTPILILWISSFLTNRKQRVRFGTALSSSITTNTGAPQGCVLSPLLFTLYTSDCRSSDDSTRIFKYADDTVIVGQLNRKSNEEVYRQCIDNFVDWCSDNFLLLNTKKTKEIIFDFSKKEVTHDPIIISGEQIDVVESYKYLGSHIDCNLKWSINTDNICSKVNKRLYYLRKLKKCNVDNTILTLFYESVICSVLSFCVTAWFGSLSADLSHLLHKVERTANKIIRGEPVKTVETLHQDKVHSMIDKIFSNCSHPLRQEYHVLRSGLRLRVHKSKTNRLKNSFIPSSIIYVNNLPCANRQDLLDLLVS
jgi:hypothetical protein